MFEENTITQAAISVRESKKDASPSLYVINTCDLGGIQQKGQLHIKLELEAGKRPLKVCIPDTWIPWELTKYAPKEVWLKDTDFIRLVDKSIITIIKNDIAEEILNQDAAIHEEKRLKQKESELKYGFKKQEAVMSDIIKQNKSRDKVREFYEQNKKPSQTSMEVLSKDTYSPSAKLVAIMNNKSLEEISKLNALMNMSKELQPSDYNYIMSKTPLNNNKIKEWVLSKQMK